MSVIGIGKEKNRKVSDNLTPDSCNDLVEMCCGRHIVKKVDYRGIIQLNGNKYTFEDATAYVGIAVTVFTTKKPKVFFQNEYVGDLALLQ